MRANRGIATLAKTKAAPRPGLTGLYESGSFFTKFLNFPKRTL